MSDIVDGMLFRVAVRVLIAGGVVFLLGVSAGVVIMKAIVGC